MPIRCFVLVAMLASAAAAQTFPNFNQVPHTYAQDPARFAALFQSGHSGTVRLAWLGDSQETSPGGAGNAYIPQLGRHFFGVYGNVPEAQMTTPMFSYGGGAPPSEFILSGSSLDRSATRIAGNAVPPGMAPAIHTAPG